MSGSATLTQLTLEAIEAQIKDCSRCKLSISRNKLVFGSGPADARIVFVGEGPGADEDDQGLPFVGRAGKLLTAMINNTAREGGWALRREDVYITNVVKCRPPGNRTPEPGEVKACLPFLEAQLEAIRPAVICCLGATAARTLLDRKVFRVTSEHGQWHAWRSPQGMDFLLMTTFHPAFLLRSNRKEYKLAAWRDLIKLFTHVYGSPGRQSNDQTQQRAYQGCSAYLEPRRL